MSLSVINSDAILTGLMCQDDEMSSVNNIYYAMMIVSMHLLKITMKKLSLLKEYIKLIVESQTAPFLLKGPLMPLNQRHSRSQYYTVSREFAIVTTPELMEKLHTKYSDIEDGMIISEFHIEIEADVWHEPYERRTYNHPGNQESYEIQDWKPVAINGFALTEEDQNALLQYMGDLTEGEEESILEDYRSQNEREYDDPPSYDFDD